MTDEGRGPPVSGDRRPDEPEEQDSIVDLLSRLVDDAERFVRAEMQLYRAQLFARLRQGRTAIILLAVAFFLAQSAVVAFLVGLVATLRASLGPAGATATVVVGALAVAAILARIAFWQLGKATDVEDGPA